MQVLSGHSKKIAVPTWKKNRMTRLDNLENLLLKPEATEVSYGYIESLVTERVASKFLVDGGGKDYLCDLLDLLNLSLQRAGSGWAVVVSKRISARVLIGILSQMGEVSFDLDVILGSLYRLVESHPVIALCDFESLMANLLRILKANAKPSSNLMRLLASVLTVRLPSNSQLDTIATIALSHLAVSVHGSEASSCLLVLSKLTEYITRDSQLVNTTIGLAKFAVASFAEDSEVRRLAAEIITVTPQVQYADASASVPKETEVVVPRPVTVTQTIDTVIAEMVTTSAHQEVDASSPRSSCPSLD